MSISGIQKRRKTKEFYEKLLKKGIEPNNYEMNRMLTEYFDVHTPGMPCYSPILQNPYEVSSKADYNHNFLTLDEDLHTIYEANIEVNNKAVAMQQYYDLEKNRVRNAISRLQLRVENVTEALKKASRVKQYVQVFDDMYDIEYYGNPERNIPYTTAFVDLLQKKVYTETMTSNVNKLSIPDATVRLDGFKVFNQSESKGTLSKILTDTLNETYILKCTDEKDEAKEISIIVNLGSIMEFNMVSFSFTSTKEMTCEMYLSDDGENYIPSYDVTSRDFIEWNFSMKKAQYIKIVCHKYEADALSNLNGTDIYEYYFVFKNISIAKEKYEAKSVFVSKPIDFDDLTSVIKLDATDRIFNNTRIDYFIGFDNGRSKIGWDAITNHKDHELFMFEKTHKIANYHVDDFGVRGDELELYKIFKLPKNVSKNSIKLTAGYNMWSVKRYNHKSGDSEDNGFSLSTSDFSEHAANCNVSQMFMDCENYDNFQVQTNVLYVFTQYIQLEQAATLFDAFIKPIINIKTKDNEDAIQEQYSEIKVFLNGHEVMISDTDKYSFALRKGVNKVQIALYCPSLTAATFNLYHNLNFKSLTNNCFAFTPMKYTSNAILENTIGDSYMYYTIKDDWLYVKCNPDDMIASQIEDMGYFLTYSALKEDMSYYFDSNHLRFRIMAVLTSNDKNLSPEIINFRITGK